MLTPSESVAIPDADLADVADIPLFSHSLTSKDDQTLKGWRYTLRETVAPPPAIEHAIWQQGERAAGDPHEM